MRSTTVYHCSLIELPTFKNRAGNISIAENLKNLPFKVQRVFYIYDIPGGEDRGAHAHKRCHQFLVAASGSFEIELNDGINKRTIQVNRPYFGFHIPPGIWAAEKSFSSGAVCLVLASEKYNDKDYIKNYSDFLKYKKVRNKINNIYD